MNLVSAHCPLCVHIPTVNLKKSAIVFLDMDGVMINRQNHAESILKTQFEKFGKNASPLQNRIAAAYHLKETAVQSIKLLIEKIEKVKPAYIVISSAWRQDCTLDELKNQVFGVPGLEILKERVIGKTPSPKDESWAIESDSYFQKRPEKNKVHFEDLANEKYGISFKYRAGEIAFWLAFHKIEDCDFIVFDDDYSERLEHFGKRFIGVNMLSGQDIDLAMNTIFQWNKPSEWSDTSINKESISRISRLLPNRFIYFKKEVSYSDEDVGLILASHIAEKTTKITAKFLTPKGHLEKSIRPKFTSEPTEFPTLSEVAQFTEETRKFLINNMQQALKEDKKEIFFSVDALPKGDLKKLLKLAGISKETHPQYGFYFPQGMKIKFNHIQYKSGGGMFKCLMDFNG